VLGAALLVAGLVLVVAGAELFFEALLDSAARLRVSAYALTVVVSGFELENLAAGIAANANGLPNAAAGTFLGGTTFLALGVAGAGAVLAPVRAGLPRGALAWTAVAALPLLGLSVDGTISRFDGALLLGWFALALAGLVAAGRGRLGLERCGRRRFAALRLLAGLGLLTLGGELLGEGLRRVVARFGVSESLLGNTAVAASVEAEEVARVVAPARRGRGDVALGNVLGTIVHFVAFNAGVIALVRPIELDSASQWLHLPVAAAAPVVLAALLLARPRLGRPEGVLLLAAYAAYVAAAILVSV
jgi:cation:H+ antiporter